ncbi:MAG: nucleoside monophosphate kinase [Patescibacteria group bacterium]
MVIFFGIAGSGKGTQAALLSKRMGWPTLSSGEVMRRNLDNPAIKAKVESGQLVGDEELKPLLEREFRKLGADKHEFILDGTPRNVEQARWLDQKIKGGELRLTAIIHINLSEQTALERLGSRGRHDDDSGAIKGRFKFYEKSVVPAMSYLKSQGYKIDEISGEATPAEVEASIQRVLEAKS